MDNARSESIDEDNVELHACDWPAQHLACCAASHDLTRRGVHLCMFAAILTRVRCVERLD